MQGAFHDKTMRIRNLLINNLENTRTNYDSPTHAKCNQPRMLVAYHSQKKMARCSLQPGNSKEHLDNRYASKKPKQKIKGRSQ